MSFSVYEKTLSLLEAGCPALLISLHKAGAEPAERLCLSEEEAAGLAIPAGLDTAMRSQLAAAMETKSLQWAGGTNGSWFLVEYLKPKPRLVILGGGHIAVPLSELASMAGFHVTVCDDRPSFANRARFPKADAVHCEYFENFLAGLEPSPATYVAIVTRGHRHDLDCYRRLAGRDFAYIGMIGSRKRVAEIRARLSEEGVSPEILEKLHAPIGLDIGAIGPVEISLSIVAELISVRRAGNPRNSRSAVSEELDMDVLRELAGGGHGPCALVTVVGAKGSIPRGIGAKMLVWRDGRTLGSIGGGCSEGEVLVIARDIVREGGHRLHHVDMTGKVGEDEGMVCGGIMDVLIERL